LQWFSSSSDLSSLGGQWGIKVCAFLVCSVEVYSAAASILGLACQQDLVTVVVPALYIAVGCMCLSLILESLDQMLKFLVFIVFLWWFLRYTHKMFNEMLMRKWKPNWSNFDCCFGFVYILLCFYINSESLAWFWRPLAFQYLCDLGRVRSETRWICLRYRLSSFEEFWLGLIHSPSGRLLWCFSMTDQTCHGLPNVVWGWRYINLFLHF
jgi:hypothetical protein